MEGIKRNYEVSIWTLQDDFITVLKASNLEYKGSILNGKANIKDDGTQEISLSIPMYVYEGVQRIVNPIWYTTKDGTIAESMRKIKLILNKRQKDERVFEFVILKVKERHSSDELYCDVEGSGLAFEELGKVGYKITLSGDDFYEEDYQWFTQAKDSQGNLLVPSEPKATIQYWNNKFLTEYPANGKIDSTKWYYRVQMNHDSDGSSSLKFNNKIYEDEYVSSWDDDGRAIAVESYKEKTRIVDIAESNIYNITQKIAETFGVFCRYDYLYDDNYHIIGRIVTYYNTFLQEREGYFDITYSFDTNDIQRERDSSDIATKMFVRPVENSFSDSNLSTIATAAANKAGEDYLLNFDYLYSIGTISKEQYEEIEVYENKLHILNNTLVTLSNQLVDLQSKLPEVEAKQTIAGNSVDLDKEAISSSNALFNSITHDTGKVTVTANAPDSVVLLQDSTANYNVDTYYFKAPRQGIIPSTLKFYSTHSSSNSGNSLSGELTGRIVLDEFGCVEKVVDIVKSSSTRTIVYLTYEYSPYLYYEKVKQVWENKLAQDQSDYELYTQEITDLKDQIANLEESYNAALEEKAELVVAFERMMGPALREGYWQPEDYKDYGDKHKAAFTPSAASTVIEDENDTLSTFLWDTKLFDEEQDSKYQSGIDLATKYYLCIDLTNHWSAIQDKLDQISFLFYDYISSSTYPYAPKNLRSFGLGADCELAFINKNDTPTPVLLITGSKNLADSEIANMKNTARLGILSSNYNSSTNKIEITISNERMVNNDWLVLSESTPIIYPRIKIDSLLVKNSEDQLALKYNDDVLAVYEDYYVLTRDNSYYITIKPEVLFRYADYQALAEIQYTVSNADTSIYLDARKIHKENAYPKVSYEIKLAAVKPDFLYNDYNAIGYICNINDEDLRLRNVQGYISEVSLDLDHIYQDSIVLKNYRNRFEDLFSTIVAQTEEMKKNAYAIDVLAGMVNADGQLTSNTLSESLNNNLSILNSYVNAGFEDYLAVSPKIKQIFDEAGQIIKDSAASFDGIHALTTGNGAILGTFAEAVASGLTPTIYSQSTRPSNFKPGDIWEDPETGDRYIAMSYSDITISGGGWNKTYDGSLASITGAGLDIDAAAGTIDMYANSSLTARAGSNMYLASDEIQITGNSLVNIGGKRVNIGANSGVYIVTSNIDSDTQYNADGSVQGALNTVSLDGDGITMATDEGITMYAGSNSTVAAVKINREDGIYLGTNSDKGVTIYSGNIEAEDSSAAVEISKDKILFGVSNVDANTTAVEMTDDYVILAAGDAINILRTIDPTATNLASGVKITKDLIGFATGANDNRRAIIMDFDGVMISSGTNIDANLHTGNYVNITNSGIDLGGSGNLYLNTANIQLQTTDASGTGEASTLFALGTNLNNNDRNPSLVFDGTDLYITGTIRAGAGVLGGLSDTYAKAWKIGDGILYSGDGVTYVALDSGNSGITKDDYTIWAGNSVAASAPFSITRGGKLKATDATITGTIYATNLYVGSNQEAIENYISDKIPESDKITGTYLTMNATTGTIAMNSGKTLSISGGNVYIRNSDNTSNVISLTPTGVTIAGASLNMTGASSISLATNGSFHVESGAFSVSPSGASINGSLLNNGKPVLTSDYIVYSTSAPSTTGRPVGALWLKPYNGGSSSEGGGGSSITTKAVSYAYKFPDERYSLRGPSGRTVTVSTPGATSASGSGSYTYTLTVPIGAWSGSSGTASVTATINSNSSLSSTIDGIPTIDGQHGVYTFIMTSSTWYGGVGSLSIKLVATSGHICTVKNSTITLDING